MLNSKPEVCQRCGGIGWVLVPTTFISVTTQSAFPAMKPATCPECSPKEQKVGAK